MSNAFRSSTTPALVIWLPLRESVRRLGIPLDPKHGSESHVMASETFHGPCLTGSKGPQEGHGLSHYANGEPQNVDQFEPDHE